MMNRTNDLDQGASKFKVGAPLTLLFAGLFALAAAGGVYLFIDNNELNSKVAVSESKLVDVESQRENLQDELVVIEENFNQKILENEELSNTLKERLKEVDALQWRVADAKKKLKVSEDENIQIVSRLGRLEVLKSELEQDIAALAVTNTELKLANSKIVDELALANEYAKTLNEYLAEMSEKNTALIDHLYTIAPAGFIADNFVVRAKRRNEKLTSKARSTEQISVSFDLNNVPDLYQGEEEIYLVLAKFDGQPVANIASKTVQIASKEPFTIKAADIEKLSLNGQQSLDMSVNADKDLEAGTYNLLVYAGHGFLGATSFQLR